MTDKNNCVSSHSLMPTRLGRRSRDFSSGSSYEAMTEIEIPSHKENVDFKSQKPIDETHTPKKLTITTENLICRLSATHLSKLQETISAVEKDPSFKSNFDQINEDHIVAPVVKFEKQALRDSQVLVLYTGGTIGMRCKNGVYQPEPHYLPGAIRELPPLNDFEYSETQYADAQVKPYCLPPIRGEKRRIVYWLVEYEPLLDSSDMTFDDWIRIAHDIEKSYSAYDGFVILHGTDTLAYTACALSFMMENLGKPVVVTGSQIPVAEARSDGRENMIGALIIAGCYDIPEVTVLFNNKLMRGNRVTKLDNCGLDAFHSPNMASLATMDISVNVNYESIFRSSEVAPFYVHGNLCRSVVVLRIFPSMPIESVQASLRPPTLGVVLQTFGSGNMPLRRTDIIEEIARAVKRGCLVLNVSQCIKGHVEVNYANGKIVADTGVIPGSDITTEAALAKLAYILSKNSWDLEMKNLMLQRNLRGEVTVVHSEHINEIDLIPKLAKFLSITSSLETRLLRNALFPPLVCNAAHANDIELLEQLRLSGANVASADYSMRTALHVAAAAGSLEAVKYLLKHGVSVHGKDFADENALLCAVRSKNIKIIQSIRSAGGQLVVHPSRIGVELCLAAGNIDLDTLEGWYEAGADLSTADYNGRTALHVSCHRGLYKVVKYLCSKGVDATVCDHFGATPIDECIRVMKAIETIHPSVMFPSSANLTQKMASASIFYDLDDVDDYELESVNGKKVGSNFFSTSNILGKKVERNEEAKRIYDRLKKVKELLSHYDNTQKVKIVIDDEGDQLLYYS